MQQVNHCRSLITACTNWLPSATKTLYALFMHTYSVGAHSVGAHIQCRCTQCLCIQCSVLESVASIPRSVHQRADSVVLGALKAAVFVLQSGDNKSPRTLRLALWTLTKLTQVARYQSLVPPVPCCPSALLPLCPPVVALLRGSYCTRLDQSRLRSCTSFDCWWRVGRWQRGREHF